ncbi:MAG TPA: hypothetical protein VMA34_12580 [Terracidiphilus sp.]|nr:hypothetical protein [Terracidiphilus sp.]
METIPVTLSVQIAWPAAEAYRFVADPATMPQWAIHNVKSTRPLAANEWEIETPRDAGRLIPQWEQRPGFLDHEFIDLKEGSWAVCARIVPAGAGGFRLYDYAGQAAKDVRGCLSARRAACRRGTARDEPYS